MRSQNRKTATKHGRAAESDKPRDKQKRQGGKLLEEQATEHILQKIWQGVYVPGQRLVVADLVEETGLRQGVIRDALRILAGEGVVELIPNKGARIPRFDRSDLPNIIRAIEAVCAAGLRAATANAQAPANRKRLKEALAAIHAAAKSGNAHDLVNSLPEYHYVANDISGNPYYNVFMDRIHLNAFLRELTNGFLSRAMTSEHWKAIADQYQAINDALIAGDAQRAAATYAVHTQNLIDIVENPASAPNWLAGSGQAKR